MEKFNSVLLIDDDHTNNFIAEKLIRRLGLSENVQLTTNVEQALFFLNTCEKFPEIIFLDLHMPKMDGYDFLEAFKSLDRDTKNIHVVILSSSEDKRDLDKVQNFGIKYYISKPLKEQNLLKICEIIRLNLKMRFVMLGT